MKKIALLAIAAFAAITAHATPITGLYNTGAGAGVTDTHYTIGGNATYVATNSNAFPLDQYWSKNTSTSSWLMPTASQGQTFDPSANGTYVWDMIFQIGAQSNASTASFAGRFAADNSAIAYLNGHEIGTSSGFGENDWGSFSALVSSDYFVNGANKFEVVVTNYAQNSGNPTGLRVEFTSSNITAVPEPASYAMVLAGLALMGLVLRRRKAS